MWMDLQLPLQMVDNIGTSTINYTGPMDQHLLVLVDTNGINMTFVIAGW